MALQYCRECGDQVSTEAAACPHCGAPVARAPAPTPHGVQIAGDIHRPQRRKEALATLIVVATLCLSIPTCFAGAAGAGAILLAVGGVVGLIVYLS